MRHSPMRLVLSAALWAALSFLDLGAALAAECAPRAEIVANLERQYGEATVGLGLDQRGTAAELLTSPSGSWTVIVTNAAGWACIIAYGTDWQTIVRQPAPRGKPS